MIVVTGTGRSGTSMWMQALIAAGTPYVGEAFPGALAKLAGANPLGFYEDKIRDHGSNEPRLKGHAVKLFIQGVLRTHESNLERVVFTMRPFQEFAQSSKRMRAMTTQAPGDQDRLALSWWRSNYGLTMDAWRRGYPVRTVTYAEALSDPHKTVSDLISWLGVEGLDVNAAAAAIAPSVRTQTGGTEDFGVDPRDLDTFGALYDQVAKKKPLTAALVTKMAKTQERMKAKAAQKVKHG